MELQMFADVGKNERSSALMCVLRFSGASGQAEGDGLCGHPAQTHPGLRPQPQRQVGHNNNHKTQHILIRHWFPHISEVGGLILSVSLSQGEDGDAAVLSMTTEERDPLLPA